jgi:hypothetical protein
VFRLATSSVGTCGSLRGVPLHGFIGVVHELAGLEFVPELEEGVKPCGRCRQVGPVKGGQQIVF